MPAVLGENGVQTRVPISLNEEEQAKLETISGYAGVCNQRAGALNVYIKSVALVTLTGRQVPLFHIAVVCSFSLLQRRLPVLTALLIYPAFISSPCEK